MPDIPILEQEDVNKQLLFVDTFTDLNDILECVHKLATIRNCSPLWLMHFSSPSAFTSIAIYYNDGKMQYSGMFHEFLINLFPLH